MLGIDPRAARYTWTAIVVISLVALVYAVRNTLFVFIVALLLGYLLWPLVNLLNRILPASRTRTPALALAYVVFVGGLVLAIVEIGSRAVEQANSLAKGFPQMLAQWEKPTPGAMPAINSLKQKVLERIREELNARASDLIAMLPRAGSKMLSLAGRVVYVVIVPILAFFFLKDAHELRQHLLDLAGTGPWRGLIDDLMLDVHLLLAHYMRALLILCLSTFTCYSIFFSIMSVPYGLLLAALAFLLEFIPMVGPLTAALAILLVAGLSGAHVLAILIFLAAFRLFQDYILSPYLMGAGVELHPLAVLFGVFAGAEIAGVPGTFLSVPVLALLRIVYRRMRRGRSSTKGTLVETPVISI